MMSDYLQEFENEWENGSSARAWQFLSSKMDEIVTDKWHRVANCALLDLLVIGPFAEMTGAMEKIMEKDMSRDDFFKFWGCILKDSENAPPNSILLVWLRNLRIGNYPVRYEMDTDEELYVCSAFMQPEVFEHMCNVLIKKGEIKTLVKRIAARSISGQGIVVRCMLKALKKADDGDKQSLFELLSEIPGGECERIWCFIEEDWENTVVWYAASELKKDQGEYRKSVVKFLCAFFRCYPTERWVNEQFRANDMTFFTSLNLMIHTIAKNGGGNELARIISEKPQLYANKDNVVKKWLYGARASLAPPPGFL